MLRTSPALTPGQEIVLRMDTAERTWKALTPKQRSELRRAAAAPRGILELSDGRRGLRRSGWEKMMRRMQEAGVVYPYVHGGFEITQLGRKALTFDTAAVNP